MRPDPDRAIIQIFIFLFGYLRSLLVLCVCLYKVELACSIMDGSDLKAVVISTLAGRTVSYPLDTVRTWRMASDTGWKEKKDFTSKKKDFAKLFFRGLPSTLLFSVPGTAVYIFTYTTWRNEFHDRLPRFLCFITGGALAELVSGLIFTPMEVLKQRQQAQVAGYAGLRNSLRSIAFRPTDLYRGYWMGMMLFVPYSSLFFLFYETLKAETRFFQDNMPVCSIVSAAFASILTTPLDVIKTKLQVKTKKRTISEIIVKIYREAGLAGFGKGTMSRLLFSCCNTGIVIGSYDMLRQYLKKS